MIAGPGVTHSLARAVGTGIIKNDDVSVSIASLGPVAEGQSGLTPFGFRATITAPLPEAVTFTYSTVNGTTDPVPAGRYTRLDLSALRTAATRALRFTVAVS